jgi:hypothetical protein
LWKYACKCYIFHLINCSQNVGTFWLKFAFFTFFFMDHVQKQIVNINTNTKKFEWLFYPHIHQSNIIITRLSWKTYTQNVTKTNTKNAKFSNFIMKMKQTKKIFPCKLYPFNIDVYFKHQNTSCTLLKIVYIIQVLNTWIFLNNIINQNFIH